MQIRIMQLIEGARRAEGLTVIIDVFRAFTTACYVFGNGAKRIIPVDDIQLAYQLKEDHPDYILMGERGGIIQPGFDYGNSPFSIDGVRFDDRTVIQTTSAGTQGIMSATDADEIISGSFVNAGAIVRYIRSRRPRQVSLVAMGENGMTPTDEDLRCAEYLKNALEQQPNDFQQIASYLRTYRTAQKFFDPAIHWAPERDFELCVALDRFPFVLKAIPFHNSLLQFKMLIQ